MTTVSPFVSQHIAQKKQESWRKGILFSIFQRGTGANKETSNQTFFKRAECTLGRAIALQAMLSLGPVNINRYKIYRESEEPKLMRFLLLLRPRLPAITLWSSLVRMVKYKRSATRNVTSSFQSPSLLYTSTIWIFLFFFNPFNSWKNRIKHQLENEIQPRSKK